MDTLGVNFTVTVTAIAQPPDNGGLLTWRSWYSATPPTATTQFFEGSQQTTFGAGTTTLTLTAGFTQTDEEPPWGFCQGLSYNQPVAGYYTIDVYASADVGLPQVVTSASTYIEVS
jgi:hypothetical protein